MGAESKSHGYGQEGDRPTADRLREAEGIIGENGLLKELTKAILERALRAEMTDHLEPGCTMRTFSRLM